MMYTITLCDGTKLENLELNGNNFISDTIIEDSVFENNLDSVEISDGSTSEHYSNMRLLTNRIDGGRSWFAIGEKSAQQLHDEMVQAQLDALTIALLEA